MSLFQDIGGKISRNALLKVFDRDTVLESLKSPLNFELGEGLIIRDVLNVARLFRLHYKVGQFAPSTIHSKLDLVVVGMGSLEFEFTIKK